MSLPIIKVYPTETQGFYQAEDGQGAFRRHLWLIFNHRCRTCNDLLSGRLAKAWQVGDHFYCHHCVRIVAQEVPT